LAEIIDVDQITTSKFDQLKHFTDEFLNKNNLTLGVNDLLILGRNGDQRTDVWYDFFVNEYKHLHAICYKNMCGEYRTASAFACYLGVQILSDQFRNFKNCIGSTPQFVNHILIYNHFDGERHGLTLLRRNNFR
jgi:hypothetical protein